MRTDSFTCERKIGQNKGLIRVNDQFMVLGTLVGNRLVYFNFLH